MAGYARCPEGARRDRPWVTAPDTARSSWPWHRVAGANPDNRTPTLVAFAPASEPDASRPGIGWGPHGGRGRPGARAVRARSVLGTVAQKHPPPGPPQLTAADRGK